MNSGSLPKGRARISIDSLGLRITIPSRKKVFSLLCLAIWLVFWGFAGIASISSQLAQDGGSEGGGRLIIFLACWLVGLILVLFSFLWTLFGKEALIVDGHRLSVMSKLFGVGPKKDYELSHIKRMRIIEDSSKSSWFRGNMGFSGIHAGMIAFDYGAKTFRIAKAIDAAEAHQIIDLMASRFPIDKV